MPSERSFPPAQTAALFAGGVAAGVGAVCLAQQLWAKDAPPPPVAPVEFVARRPRATQPPRHVPRAPPTTEAEPHAPSELALDSNTVVGVTGVAQPRPAAQAGPAHLATAADLLATDAASAPPSTCPAWIARMASHTAADLVAQAAYQRSSAVFVYDADATAFGRSLEQKQGRHTASGPAVFSLQTRAGAAATALGYLARARGSASILTDAQGFVTMAPALAFAPSHGRIVVQVSGAGRTEAQLRVVDDAPRTLLAASTLPDDEWTVVYTSDQYEAVDIATATYRATKGNVVHVFDGAFSAREVDYGMSPSAQIQRAEGETVRDVLAAAQWDPFHYVGQASAETVLVVPNTSIASSAKLAYARLSKDLQARVGVVCARIPKPWNEAAFRSALPQGAKRVVVLDLDHGLLDSHIEGALVEKAVHVSSLPVPTDEREVPTPLLAAALQLISSGATTWDQVREAASTTGGNGGFAGKLLTLLDTETSNSTFSASLVGALFAQAAAKGVVAAKVLHCRSLQRYDNFHGPHASGIVRSDIVFGPRTPSIVAATQQGRAQTLVLPSPAALTSCVDALSLVAPSGVLLLDTSAWEGNAAETIEEHLAPLVRRHIAELGLKLFSVDAASVLHFLQAATKVMLGPEFVAVVLALAALQVHLTASKQTLTAVAKPALEQVGVDVDTLVDLVSAAVTPLPYERQDFAQAKEEEDKPPPTLASLEYTGFTRLAQRGSEPEAQPKTSSWASAAWQRLYPEAYNLDARALRGDLAPEPLWQVEVTENRRLTPLDYDRNVFHLELSTRGTGLRYEVGQALGVHGWNDTQQVEAFLRFTGLGGEQLVTVPSPGGRAESLTLFQLLQQRKDIFGRPGKSFYAALADLALDPAEGKWLRFVASPEGNSLFKKYSEVETVTYAGVLRMFPSVLGRLDVAFLLREVEDIQPRHYSIASAQAAVGESVHLLIVAVDWRTPSGALRYGQCTRYLSQLRVGDRVTVSLRPSVMKLPPLPEQPIIMAGLGTGAAPFRAFLQARAVQRAEGKPIGPLVYYFGSRYRSKEYLYGEELEAFQRDGVLTQLGLAFSRDQDHKIYIQDKIQQDAQIMAAYLAPELAANSADFRPASLDDALVETQEKNKGYFYLCGPTWPVPDITEAVLTSLEENKGLSRAQAEEHLERLKEQERWVLEVY